MDGGICVGSTCTRTSYTKVIYCLLDVGSSLKLLFDEHGLFRSQSHINHLPQLRH